MKESKFEGDLYIYNKVIFGKKKYDHARLSTSERTLLTAYIEINLFQNCSALLPLNEWECSSVLHFLTVDP